MSFAGSRTVPVTRLRELYLELASLGTAERRSRCDEPIAAPERLANLFLDALSALQGYDNRDECFYPPIGRSVPRARGTIVVTDLLASGRMRVPAIPGYEFDYLHREVSPLRTTRGRYPGGTAARKSGRGEIDYLAIRPRPVTPILGEIKRGSDKDAFYALVQLLTYLSELSSEEQATRANAYLFAGKLPRAPVYDLHILLADFDDRGTKGPLIDGARRLAEGFKATLLSACGDHRSVGAILCLRMDTARFDGTLELVWRA